MRKAVEGDPTSLYGAIYIKPKHQVLPNTTRAFWKTITKVDV